MREAIAARYGVAPEKVFVGNGSDEVLAHTFQALLKHDAPLLFPDITYSFYPVYCRPLWHRLRGGAARCRDARAARRLPAAVQRDPPAQSERADRHRLSRGGIEALLAEHPDQLVVIDEAYVDFGGESAVPLVARHDNLLVVQTLSKSRALAGLRVGFAIGQRPLIEALERVKDSFNSYPLDRLAMAGAVAAIEDDAWFQETRARIIASRESLVSGAVRARLRRPAVAGEFRLCAPSRPSRRRRLPRTARARRSGAAFPKAGIQDFLRITVGTDEQCGRLIAVLRELV